MKENAQAQCRICRQGREAPASVRLNLSSHEACIGLIGRFRGMK